MQDLDRRPSCGKSLRPQVEKVILPRDGTWRRWIIGYPIAFCLPFLMAGGDPSVPPTPPALHPVIGITEPFRVATLASVQPARIADIRVEEGAFVPKGEIVVALEDGIQKARTELAKASMETSLPVDLERARLSRAKRDLDRLKRLQGDDFASSKELSDTLAFAEIAQIEYDLSVFNQEQARRAYERERETLAEYHLRAPFPAYLAAHLKHPGETVDQLEGIVRLVQLDPLLVTVDCPFDLWPSVALGDRYLIRPTDPRWSPRPGTVVFAGKAADAASQTFKVKLTVGNDDREWMAGLKVVVDFAVDGVGLAPSDEGSTVANSTAIVKNERESGR